MCEVEGCGGTGELILERPGECPAETLTTGPRLLLESRGDGESCGAPASKTSAAGGCAAGGESRAVEERPGETSADRGPSSIAAAATGRLDRRGEGTSAASASCGPATIAPARLCAAAAGCSAAAAGGPGEGTAQAPALGRRAGAAAAEDDARGDGERSAALCGDAKGSAASEGLVVLLPWLLARTCVPGCADPSHDVILLCGDWTLGLESTRACIPG